MNGSTHHYFVPSVRLGLSAAISEPSDSHRAGISVLLRATAQKMGSGGEDTADIRRELRLYGPGDILGFHDRIVVRRHPEPDVGDFEPNYFPAIEFADSDFAWRFTADRAEAQTGKLKPWITLVVLASNGPGELGPEFVEIARSDRNLPPQIAVTTAALPNLQYAWRWAHVHITEQSGKQGQLEQMIRDEPEVAVCRLLCARRLAPKTRYTAFVLPTFKLGVLAGLGEDLDPSVTALSDAWHLDDTKDEALPYYVGDEDQRPPEWPGQLQEGVVLKIPYYYRWEFGTGLRGDFEHLVRLLEPRKLSGLGVRNIDCHAPGFFIAGVDRNDQSETEPHYLGMEGALRSLDTQYTPWGRDPAIKPAREPAPLQFDLADLLNEPEADQALPPFSPEFSGTAGIDEISVRLHPSGTSVTIRWRTLPAALSRVEYGKTTAYQDSIESCTNCPNEPHEHRAALAGLAPGTRYYFKIVAMTQTGTTDETPTCSFEMPPLPSVVPPIYGRWHRGRDEVVAQNQEQWLDVVNLDPRHRAAAGLGSEVVRKQQEPLMASAWDQLGAIESANDILRRAQFGRDTSLKLHERLAHLATEDFLRVTSPAQKRLITEDPDSGRKMTVTQYLKTQSRIPEAAVDPAFRRIIRPRGPIRKRQAAGRSVDLLSRLASGAAAATRFGPGTAPKPAGTIRLCDITRRMAQPKVTLTATPGSVGVGETTTLSWSSTDMESCTPIGWSDSRARFGSEEVVPFPTGGGGGGSGGTTEPGTGPDIELDVAMYAITCNGPFGSATASVEVGKRSTPLPGGGGGGVDDTPLTGTSNGSTAEAVSSLRFCDGLISCAQIRQTVSQHQPFQGVAGAPNPDTMIDVACGAIDNWLEKQPETAVEQPPIQAAGFVDSVKNVILPAIDPKSTVVERTKKRLRLAGDLAQRFEEGATGDPLDSIMWAPEFPQPMYEPLRDISHELLLPGVEKIPQNTLGLLQTNRRFLESYLCGNNHEFAGELLWRGYPTDQRGSYFRQFWDVSEYNPRSDKRLGWLFAWIKSKTGQISAESDESAVISAVSRQERERLLWRHAEVMAEELAELWESRPPQGNPEDIQKEQERRRRILTGIDGGRASILSNLSDEEINNPGLAPELAIQEQICEELKDANRLTDWKSNALGDNATRPGEDLVLVVRGDLLKRYPNAVIYSADAMPRGGDENDLVPALSEYISENDIGNRKAVFPVFKATLPPDMTFFGFPFSDEETRGNGGYGKFFVIEEQVAEPRFGLDVPAESPSPIRAWPDNLRWSHFGFGNQDESFHYGRYLDNPPDPNLALLVPADPPGADPTGPGAMDPREQWQNASSARLAWATCQDPVRIAVHARQMLPTVAAYFEMKGPDPQDRFVIKLVHPDKIQHARNILDGSTTDRLHIKGLIVPRPATYNPAWSYHLDPDSIEFFDAAMEVCDATMRNVEDNLDDVGDAFLPGNIWCPWGSALTREITGF